MKIAHITFGFEIGGIETMLVNIANEQVKEGHDVSIVVMNDLVNEGLKAQLDPRIRFLCIGRDPQSKFPWPAVKLYFKVRALSPDVIHLHYARIARFLPGMRKKMCVTLHALCRPFNMKCLDSAGPVIAISEMVKEDIKKKTGLDSTVIYNGIKVNDIKPREYHLPGKPFKIVQLSRLDMEKKGQDILIDAVARLIKDDKREIELTFIGSGESLPVLEKMVKDHGISENVKFLGQKPQEYVKEHLCDYDLSVQPSRFDGFALTVAEAMAAKVPVLVCDNQAPVEVVGYGKYGKLFKGGDAEACAAAILDIMENYPDEAFLEMTAKFVKDTYSVENTARKYLQLYEEQVLNR